MKNLSYLFICVITLISCTKKPLADFSSSDSKTVSDTINFINLSENAKTYEWNFGDGYSSNKKSPSHHFSKPRIYTVQLTVDGDNGSASITKQLKISGTTFTVTNLSNLILTSFFSCYWNGSTVEDYVMHGTLYIGSTTGITITKRSQIYAGFSYNGSDWIFKDPISVNVNQHNDLAIGKLNFNAKNSMLLKVSKESMLKTLMMIHIPSVVNPDSCIY